jgi:predicted amidophosphoribosyltransferase
VPDALRFKPEVRSNSKDKLNATDRFVNIRNHLEWSGQPLPQGTCVIVFDDVVTSGATLFYADRLLKQAGASFVLPVALAQAIS